MKDYPIDALTILSWDSRPLFVMPARGDARVRFAFDLPEGVAEIEVAFDSEHAALIVRATGGQRSALAMRPVASNTLEIAPVLSSGPLQCAPFAQPEKVARTLEVAASNALGGLRKHSDTPKQRLEDFAAEITSLAKLIRDSQ